VVHPDVVLRDVGIRFGRRSGQFEIDRRRNPFRKALSQPDFRPLPPRPVGTFPEPFLERRQRKVQQHHECDFVAEEIVVNMRGRIITGEHFIERQNGAGVEVRLLAKLPIDFVHVPIELLEQGLQPAKHGIERRRVAREIVLREFLERRCLSIFGTPELRHLAQPSLRPSALSFAVSGDKLFQDFVRTRFDPWQRFWFGRLRQHISFPQKS